MKKVYLSIFVILGMFVLNIPISFAEFNSTPTQIVAEGDSIQTILATQSKLFFGGFSWKYTSSAHPLVFSGGAVVSTITGLASTTFPNFDDTLSGISSAVKDGSGGWYIAGGFTAVGGTTHHRVVHILASGQIDPSFNPDVSDLVNSIVLSPDKSTLYLAGQFSTVDTVSRPFLAAINATDGSLVSGFNANITGVTMFSVALSSDGTKLFAGGNFSSIGGLTRHYIAEVNAANGTGISSFVDENPTPASGNLIPFVFLKLSSDDATLYTFGAFATIGGQTRNDFATIATSNGAISSINPAPNAEVRTVEISSDGTTLYAGGDFTSIAGGSRTRIAALKTSDGSLVSGFNPTLACGAGTPGITNIALSSNDSTLFISGFYSTVNGQVRGTTSCTGRTDITSLNTSDGSVTSLDAIVEGQIRALSSDNSYLIVNGGSTGGEYYSTGDLSAAAYSTSNNFLYQVGADNNLTSLAMSPDGNTLYLGGWFALLNNTSHNQIGAVHVSDGTTVAGFTATASDNVYSIIPSHDGSILYIGGRFTTVDGVGHNHVAAINASDGSIISSFTPNVGDFTPAMALSSDGATLYIGGDFTTVDGVTRNHIAAINTSDGSLIAGFNPNITGKVRSLALSPDGTILYVSGQFTKVGVTTRNNIAAVHTSDGSLVAGFDPNANALVRTMVLTNDGSRLYAAGQFTTIGGQAIAALASINTADGSINTAFNQTAITATAGAVGLAISPDNSKLYAGKGQGVVPNNAFIALNIFTDPSIVTNPPTVTVQAASSITDTVATLNGNITATGGANPTVRGFVYGTTVAYGATTTENGSFSTGAYTANVSSLTCATTYHFKAYATNTSGSGYSADNTFTTAACSGGGGGGSGGSGSGGGGIILSGQGGHGIPIFATTTAPPAFNPPLFPLVYTTFPTPSPSISNTPNTSAGTSVGKSTKPKSVSTTTPKANPIALTNLPAPTPAAQPTLSAPSNSEVHLINNSPQTTGSDLGGLIGMILGISNSVTAPLPGVLKVLPALIPILPAVALAVSELAEVLAAFPEADGIFGYFSQLVDFILSLLGLHRRKNHLGILFDSKTGGPVALGYITLHDAATGERVAVSVSDRSGAYGFFIKPGNYIMRAAKSGYAFPSAEQGLALSFAAIYDNLYHGERITVTDEATVVGRNIPMDRTSSFKESEPVYVRRLLRQTYNIAGGFIFALGLISSFHNAWTRPSTATIIVAIIYALVLLWGFFHTREWGRLYDRHTKKVLSSYLIELNTSGSNVKIIDRAVSDTKGRFFLHSTWGRYIVKVYKFGVQQPVLQKEVTVGRAGVVNNDLGV